MAKISAKQKKWIAVVSGGILALANTPMTANVLPKFFTDPLIADWTPINIAAGVFFIGAYWLVTRQTD